MLINVRQQWSTICVYMRLNLAREMMYKLHINPNLHVVQEKTAEPFFCITADTEERTCIDKILHD